jgi:hypothetical protein
VRGREGARGRRDGEGGEVGCGEGRGLGGGGMGKEGMLGAGKRGG